MVKRKIIEIDEDKCNGCGVCVPDCPEGALKVIDGKLRLVSDIFCDGLGACIGSCPEKAISIIEREAEPYSEKKVMEKIVEHGPNTIKEHLQHLKNHGEVEYLKQAIEYLEENNIDNPLEALPCGCPGTMVRKIKSNSNETSDKTMNNSALEQWPLQLALLPTNAPFFENSHLLIASDCVPFADANFHNLLENKSLVIGCPKLDDVQLYQEKLTEIIKNNNIKSVSVAIMEVPCCHGMFIAAENAVKYSGKDISIEKVIVSIDGGR